MVAKKTRPNMTELVREVTSAKDSGASHLLVWRSRDGKSRRFEAVTAAEPDDVLQKVNAFDAKFRVGEVYDLSASLKEQYAEVRAWHPPKNKGKVKD